MILYFSATGNTRYVAQQIGRMTGDDVVDLLPFLRRERHDPLFSHLPWVITAPVYVEDIAVVVSDWFKSARLEGSRQVYFVFTTASTMGCAAFTAKAIAVEKGMTYMGSAEIQMPTNYPLMFTVPPEDACRDIIRAASPRIGAAAVRIQKGEPLPEKPFSPALAMLFHWVGVWFYRWYIRPELFHAADHCISCGKCARVCPMNNIRMKDGRPVWGGRCVHCMACVSGCPAEAVGYGKKLAGKRRYHFPENLSSRGIEQ